MCDRTMTVLLSVALALGAFPLAAADNPDKLAIQCNAGNKKSCQKLIAIARDGTADTSLVTTAVQKVADQPFLAEIAKTADNPVVRRAAIASITNQALLSDIAKTTADDDVSRAAVEKISDQAQLLDIAKTARSSSARRAAVNGLTDHVLLVDFITSGGDLDLSKSAVYRLADGGDLKNLAATHANPDIRAAAKLHFSRVVAQAAEDAIIDDVKKNGIGSRFRLSAIHAFDVASLAPDMAKMWPGPVSYTLAQVAGPTYALTEFPKDTVFMFMGGGAGGFIPMVALRLKYPDGQFAATVGPEGIRCGKFAPGDNYDCGDANGSVWRFRGRHIYKGVIFDGAENAPLTFMFWEPAGFVYITGNGTVVDKDGTVTRLP